MIPSRKLALFLVLSAGCSAGAVAGTSGPGNWSADGGAADVDSGRGDGDGDGNGNGRGEPDALSSDASSDSSRDASQDASVDADTGADAALDAAKDAALDAGPDAMKDGAKDAPIDGALDGALDAFMESGVDASEAGPIDAGVCSVDDGTWIPSSAQYHVIAKGSLWRLDAVGKLVSSSTLASISGMVQGPCASQVGTCHIDALTWRDDVAEYHLVNGGRLWRLDDHGVLLGSTALTNFSGIASGPCFGKTGAACVFEAGAWRQDFAEYELVADGTIWGVSLAGTITASRPLLSIPGVAAGPCAGQVGTCHVEGFTYRPDTLEYHVIAKGNLYVIAADGALVRTVALTSFSGLANGPCN